jgi:glycosyltransferase involved in cell wall biosynthesis
VRLLHVTDRLSQRGGADVHLLGVLAALVERGHDVTLAVERDDGTATAPCNLVIGLSELDRLAARADVIHIHNALQPELLSWAAARDAVATVQDHRSFCPGRGKLTLAGEVCRLPMAESTCAACFESADYHRRIHAITAARLEALRAMRATVVLSEYMRRELAALGIGRAHVIPPFVHGLEPRATPSGPPCVLFCGRLVAAKGPHEAARAHALARTPLPLVFAGTGPLRAELGGYEVLGWQDRAALSATYRRARALVMPSRWQEPFGIAGLEAASLGVPVAAWHSGGVEEWHPGAPPLAPWGDVDALAAALARALDRAPEEPCAVLPRSFDRDAAMDDLERLYAA